MVYENNIAKKNQEAQMEIFLFYRREHFGLLWHAKKVIGRESG
jgi:hypothetical protein